MPREAKATLRYAPRQRAKPRSRAPPTRYRCAVARVTVEQMPRHAVQSCAQRALPAVAILYASQQLSRSRYTRRRGLMFCHAMFDGKDNDAKRSPRAKDRRAFAAAQARALGRGQQRAAIPSVHTVCTGAPAGGAAPTAHGAEGAKCRAAPHRCCRRTRAVLRRVDTPSPIDVHMLIHRSHAIRRFVAAIHVMSHIRVMPMPPEKAAYAAPPVPLLCFFARPCAHAAFPSLHQPAFRCRDVAAYATMLA